jgi:hypothetical protein
MCTPENPISHGPARAGVHHRVKLHRHHAVIGIDDLTWQPITYQAAAAIMVAQHLDPFTNGILLHRHG